MKFYKKTSYAEDFRLFRDGRAAFSYALLAVALIAAPFVLPAYYLTQLVFIGIYVVAGAGLMLLSGYCGQISLGHSAFFAVGAFTVAVLEKHGIPFPLAFLAAGLLSAAVGLVIGLPALRLSGLYLAIATLAAAFIVNEVIVRWESVTNGASGLTVPKASLLGFVADSEAKLYAIVLVVALAAMLAVRNIVRAPLGLAMMAIRDSETAAQSMGVPLMRVKLTAFAVSALLTGIAGALYAHKISTLTAESFSVLLSLELLMMVVVGGLGSIKGAVLGAVFLGLLDPAIARFKHFLPSSIGEQSGLQLALYGLILVFFVLFEPLGLAGRWAKIKAYFQGFPIYRRAMFKRTKAYMTSERMR